MGSVWIELNEQHIDLKLSKDRDGRTRAIIPIDPGYGYDVQR